MWLWGGDSDSSSFRRAGIPAMTVLGASRDVIWDIIHSENDTIAHFSVFHYRNAFLLTLALIKKLDLEPARGLAQRLSTWILGSLRRNAAAWWERETARPSSS